MEEILCSALKKAGWYLIPVEVCQIKKANPIREIMWDSPRLDCHLEISQFLGVTVGHSGLWWYRTGYTGVS